MIADLVHHRDHEHGAPGGRLRRGVRQPGVQRPQRGLDGEGDEEAEEEQPLQRLVDAELPGQPDQVEGAGPAELHPALHVQPDQPGQHEQPAGQAVEQELHRGVGALRAAVAADDEVHRDQHRLEQHVEQEDVGGEEDPEHEALEHQHQGKVGLSAAPALVGVVPGGEQADRGEHGGQRDQRQRDAGEPERQGDAELRDPRVGLRQLVGGLRPGVEAQGDEHDEQQRQQRQRDGGLLRDGLPPTRHQRDEDRAQHRGEHEDAEPGERVHVRPSPAAWRRPRRPRLPGWTARRSARSRSAAGGPGRRCRRSARPGR
jgi:hypothetical protein